MYHGVWPALGGRVRDGGGSAGAFGPPRETPPKHPASMVQPDTPPRGRTAAPPGGCLRTGRRGPAECPTSVQVQSVDDHDLDFVLDRVRVQPAQVHTLRETLSEIVAQIERDDMLAGST